MRLGSGFVAGLLLGLSCSTGTTQEFRSPRISFAQVDWSAAVASLPPSEALSAFAPSPRLRSPRSRPVPTALVRLNRIMAPRFAGIATSAVPVLLPFDVDAALRDQAVGAETAGEHYFAGFHAPTFFNAGPAGYDAAFTIRASDIPELADSKFADPIEIQISGSALLYELDTPNPIEGQQATSLEPLYPGIRRFMLEHSLRYTFVRYGVPYVVSITCFDAGIPRYHMPTCRTAEVVAQRFLRALHLAGGAPRPMRAAPALPIDRPAAVSYSFGYYGPGQVLPGTGFRDLGGRVDYTVYSQIRFPLAKPPVNAGTEVFQRRSRAWNAEEQTHPALIAELPWRDNFCERRGYPVAQCPAGIGHQGQDLRPAPCRPAGTTEPCSARTAVVAVRDGVILRSVQREAAYLVVNSANEHIRFRYLHMNPAKMDADKLLSGRRVHEGEVIGQVSNFDKRINGTSYHLHFDMQVPTKDGWVFVNPYMTLVSAYERLIGARGTELSDAKVVVATADPAGATAAVAAPSSRIEPDKPKNAARHKHVSRHSPHKAKPRRQQAQAGEPSPSNGHLHSRE